MATYEIRTRPAAEKPTTTKSPRRKRANLPHDHLNENAIYNEKGPISRP
jgi:hypothetical protein